MEDKSNSFTHFKPLTKGLGIHEKHSLKKQLSPIFIPPPTTITTPTLRPSSTGASILKTKTRPLPHIMPITHPPAFASKRKSLALPHKRVLAHILDLCFISLITLILIGSVALYLKQLFSWEFIFSLKKEFLTMGSFFFVFLYLSYFVIAGAAGSIGQRVFGLEICLEENQEPIGHFALFLRSLYSLFFPLALLGIHEKITKTLVVKK